MTSDHLQQRQVVSSFIFGPQDNPQDKPQVALFRRSERVRTYRHHLAPISGSIEPHESPLTTAWREITEETTLDATTLTHWRTGKPFVFTDPSVNRQWTIHPFAFRLRNAQGANAIHTDWEHEGWEWFDPNTVLHRGDGLGSGGVPRLRDSLERVWFEGGMGDGAARVLAEGLKTLQRDHESGSQELTSIALGVFREFVQVHDGSLDEDWWATVRMAAWHLAENGRESMGISIMNALVSILGDIDTARTGEGGVDKNRIIAIIDEHVRARKDYTRQIRDSFIAHLQSKLSSSQDTDRITIITLSSSSTIRDSILDAFAALDNLQTLDLRILESRPLFEGVTLASSLSSQFQARSSPSKTLEIKLYTDASAALAAKDADMLLIGADRISSSRGVSNKTGSLPGVLSARYVQPSIEVVVLSDLDKVEGLCESNEINEAGAEENDPLEVVDAWHKGGVKGVDVLELGPRPRAGVEVKNVYFEWVPLDLIDTFVCEQGVLKGRDLEKRARQLGETMDAVLGNL